MIYELLLVSGEIVTEIINTRAEFRSLLELRQLKVKGYKVIKR